MSDWLKSLRNGNSKSDLEGSDITKDATYEIETSRPTADILVMIIEMGWAMGRRQGLRIFGPMTS